MCRSPLCRPLVATAPGMAGALDAFPTVIILSHFSRKRARTSGALYAKEKTLRRGLGNDTVYKSRESGDHAGAFISRIRFVVRFYMGLLKPTTALPPTIQFCRSMPKSYDRLGTAAMGTCTSQLPVACRTVYVAKAER